MDNKKVTPAFQLYPNDWFGSRHVSAMDSSLRGIHATLIFAAWLEPCCGFPADGEEHLTARVPENEKNSCLKVLSFCWFKYENLWFNERLLNERIKQINLSITRISTGSKGGRPKKSKCYKKKPIGYQKDSKPKPKETKSEYEKEIEIEIEERKKKFIKEVNFHNNYPVDMLNDFIRHWTEINKSRTKMRFELQETWETSKRLATWAGRSKEFKKSKSQYGRQEVSNEALAEQLNWDLSG